MAEAFTRTVYGLVHSWRFGNSLGIDLILNESTCSFNCVYCQLGNIQNITAEQKIHVPTERVLADLETVDWSNVDVATISGSGEPTLALNIGEVIASIQDRFHKPVMVLTNATLLHDEATRARLHRADTIACKLDAPDDATLQKMNRPAPGITIDRIVQGIKALRHSAYPGCLAIQCMFMPANRARAAELAQLLADIAPDEIHLNTPTRPYPRAWHIACRGAHGEQLPVATTQLRTITLEQAIEIEILIHKAVPNARILSVHREAPEENP